MFLSLGLCIGRRRKRTGAASHLLRKVGGRRRGSILDQQKHRMNIPQLLLIFASSVSTCLVLSIPFFLCSRGISTVIIFSLGVIVVHLHLPPQYVTPTPLHKLTWLTIKRSSTAYVLVG